MSIRNPDSRMFASPHYCRSHPRSTVERRRHHFGTPGSRDTHTILAAGCSTLPVVADPHPHSTPVLRKRQARWGRPSARATSGAPASSLIDCEASTLPASTAPRLAPPVALLLEEPPMPAPPPPLVTPPEEITPPGPASLNVMITVEPPVPRIPPPPETPPVKIALPGVDIPPFAGSPPPARNHCRCC